MGDADSVHLMEAFLQKLLELALLTQLEPTTA
jgi:hypothetical protein